MTHTGPPLTSEVPMAKVQMEAPDSHPGSLLPLASYNMQCFTTNCGSTITHTSKFCLPPAPTNSDHLATSFALIEHNTGPGLPSVLALKLSSGN